MQELRWKVESQMLQKILRTCNMKVFILLSVIAVALARRECGENQHYNSCGTACPLTCDNYNDPPQACILMCNPGCHCNKGYVETGDGRCVKPEQCPAKTQQCGENQYYDSCGTACPLTCDNWNDPPKACVLMCNPGCHCEKGYVKTGDGRCVTPDQCPAKNQPIRKTCLGKPETGLCEAYMPSWYYDIQSEKCHQFVYGGCGGNGNRYATEKECMEHCRDYRLKHTSADVCELPAETGPCRARVPRLFFNKKTGQCESFTYGGCGGNGNNFKTVQECQSTCQGRTRQSSVGACELSAEPGQCYGYFPRFHFNTKTGQCEEFIYGGCGGNENNFRTVEECQKSCGFQRRAPADTCKLPAEIGLCRGYFERYYYNEKSGRCQKFIYGGCGGNANNFETLEDCKKSCA